MVFSSVLFLFRFLPIFMICYFLVPRKMKNLVLFLGSLVFYAWGEPVYIFLMLFSTISDYVWGRLIEEYRGKDRSRIFLLCSIVINLFILGFFKYADFLMQTGEYSIWNINSAVKASAAHRNFLLYVPDHVLRDRCVPGGYKSAA